jgi:hypothetical protein
MLFNLRSKVLLFLYVFTLLSCSSSKDHSTIFKALNEGLNNSSKTIKRESEFVYSALEEKRKDPATAYRGDIWEPKALLLKSRSSQIISYIRNITASLKNDEDVQLVFQKNEEGKKLYDTLNSYKKDILKIDLLIHEEFGNNLNFLPLSGDSTLSKDEFDKKYFRNASISEAIALLSKLENNVVITENRIAVFCLEQIPSHGDDYTMYSAIVAQSSSHAKAGEELEIIAGVGAFTRRGNPVILINDKNIPISEDGTAHFKFKALNEAGEHRMRVRIEFTDQDGKKQWIIKEVVYSVSNK